MRKKASKKSATVLTRVPLRFEFPGAASVCVSGSFNNWDLAGLALDRTIDGAWARDLELAPGRHEYRLIVDGEWTDVPDATETVENPFGGRNAVLAVGSPS
jgi:1,4-alpha-glucan branching enzyme